jgi:uncharacterized protein (DUF427 family)
MKKQLLYMLEPYKGMNTRYICPDCQKDKSFSRYIDVTTNRYISPSVGRCNHESSCGYHYTPRQYFEDQDLTYNKFSPYEQPEFLSLNSDNHRKPDFIPVNSFKNSLGDYESNNLVSFLSKLFGPAVTQNLIKRYFIGTSDHWKGATVFWQIDRNGKIRSGKIMHYYSETGKRVKEPYNHITWIHKTLHIENFNLVQCYFGEHLLNQFSDAPIGIVESEKTAIISSVYYPEYVWLAVGSINNLTMEKSRELAGRKVTLFPDLNGYEKWSRKAKDFSHIRKLIVSNILESIATEEERQQGLDLADYLIRFNHLDFE